MKYHTVGDTTYFEGDWSKEARRNRQHARIAAVVAIFVLIISAVQF